MAGLAADRKGGRPPTQALPRQARRLFGSDSTEPAPISCFDAFSSREPVSTPDQVRGRLLLENATRDLRKPAE